MCGFSGIISEKSHGIEVLNRSLKEIYHRGPDDSLIYVCNKGFFSSEQSSVNTKNKFPLSAGEFSSAVGFNRLSIVDLSDKAMQPFYDLQSRSVFLFNGEIFNYKQLAECYLKDDVLISNSDSEVAFRLYLKLGNSFVTLLRGMFSIVVYNEAAGVLKVWRDQFGIKPFFYSHVDNQLVFSSEIKGILATGLLNKSVNFQGLAYSMYLGTCPSPLTCYNDIYSLQPGHYLEYSLHHNRLTISKYWNLEYSPFKKQIPKDEFEEDLTTLSSLYDIGDVNKGMMLSGGIDSGLLARFMGKVDPTIKCFNIYTDRHSTDERFFANLNALNANLDIEMLEIPFSPNINIINDFLTSEEEPNSSPEPTYFLCNEVQKKGIRVLFNALGPDEIFGGYLYYQQIQRYSRLKLLKALPLFCFPTRGRQKISDVQKYGWEFFPLISRQLFDWKSICQFLLNHQQAIPAHPVEYIKQQVNEIYPYFDKLPVLKRTSYLDIFYYISSHHSFRSDQPSMRHSIEMRFPFLDHVFVQKYFNDPTVFNDIDKTLKPRFRNYATSFLNPDVLNMEKKGFTMPTDNWLNSLNMNENNYCNVNHRWYQLMLQRVLSVDI
jgi:asparagine synthase (glutamine-hydrolysing)